MSSENILPRIDRYSLHLHLSLLNRENFSKFGECIRIVWFGSTTVVVTA